MVDGLPDPDADGGLASPGSAKSNHTARFKSMMPSKLPIRRSPCISIPPGFSPTTLLDSPVLFSTGRVQPSPTTGTYELFSVLQEGGSAGALGSNNLNNRSSEQDGSPTFAFKPHPQLTMPPFVSMGSLGLPDQQAPAHVRAQAQSQAGDFELTSMVSSMPLSHDPKLLLQSQDPVDPSVEPVNEPLEKVSSSQALVPTHPPPHLIERPSEYGYNWRKYGQKRVKASEYPRSYYKCTYPSCHVKKKVECSYDGQITEIVYKGEHNHPQPQATRRSAMNNSREASHRATLERAEASLGVRRMDGGSLTDPSSAKGQLTFCTPEPSLGSISDDEAEDGESSKAKDCDEDDSDFKRRKIENANEPLTNVPLRTVREPRVVVQTTSELDILDDGYRWRKYGQKVVKGNAHPRSYYKCTNVGCSVRKHVERCSKDPKAVITTYEGKHNHDVPAARNSHHDSSATAPPPPPGPAYDGNTLVKPAVSLQEQLLGKNSLIAGVGLGSGGAQRGLEQFAMRARLEGDEFFQRGLGLMPKEEPGDVHPVGGLLQPIYQQGPPSFFIPRIPS